MNPDQVEELREQSAPSAAVAQDNESYTDLELVTTRLRSAADRFYYNGLYNQMRYTFGFAWDNTPGWMTESSIFPDYPPIDTTEVEPGAHRGVFVNQFLSLVKTMYADPRPEFPQLDEVMEELRRQAFMKMWTSKGWDNDCAQMVLSGNGTGIGFIRGDWEKNDEGEMETSLKFQSPTDTMWDPHEQDFNKARWVAFLIDMPPDEAKKRWPQHAELLKNCETAKWGNNGMNIKRVRVIEYCDKQSRYIFVGNTLDASHILEKGETPYRTITGKGRLPVAAFQYFLPPKVKRPIGTILIQMASAEELRNIYKAIGESAYRQPLDIVDYDQVDKTSLEQVQAGKRKTVARKADSVKEGVPPIERIAAPQLNPEMFQWKEMQEMEFNQTGNSNEYERNTMPAGNRTKYEVQLYEAKSQGLSSWTQKRTLVSLRDVVELWLDMTYTGHTAPIELDYNGHNIQFNGPDPRSDLRYVLQEQSTINIDETSIRAQDAAQDMQNKLSRLETLKDGVDAGFYNPQKYYDEKLLILGEKDLDAWKPVAPQMQPGMQPGMMPPGAPAAGPGMDPGMMAPEDAMGPTGAPPASAFVGA